MKHIVLFFLCLSYAQPGWSDSVAGNRSERRNNPSRIHSIPDKDKDGIPDIEDIIRGARAETRRHPIYRSAYYAGGYPPENEGVCTDLIWRAFRDAGYSLKDRLDADIRANPSAYPQISSRDPNIDFRRVPNLRIFFKRHAINLPTLLVPDDRKNLAEWRAGDIVTFANPNHIAILSNRRNARGIPYLLHNDGPFAQEEDDFMLWHARGTTGHFRFPLK
jgi:uncharacterized protein YijF (DUF1287 family)